MMIMIMIMIMIHIVDLTIIFVDGSNIPLSTGYEDEEWYRNLSPDF